MTWILVIVALLLSIAGVLVTWVKYKRIDWVPIAGSVVLLVMALGLRGQSPRQ